jgi:hypothetical protein
VNQFTQGLNLILITPEDILYSAGSVHPNQLQALPQSVLGPDPGLPDLWPAELSTRWVVLF